MSLRTATSGEPSGKRQTATFKTKNGRSCPSSLISLNDCLAGPRDLEFSSRERQFSAPCSSRPTNEMFGTKLCSGRLLFMKDDVLKPAVRTTCGMADLPPSVWANFYFRIGHKGGIELRRRITKACRIL